MALQLHRGGLKCSRRVAVKTLVSLVVVIFPALAISDEQYKVSLFEWEILEAVFNSNCR